MYGYMGVILESWYGFLVYITFMISKYEKDNMPETNFWKLLNFYGHWKKFAKQLNLVGVGRIATPFVAPF